MTHADTSSATDRAARSAGAGELGPVRGLDDYALACQAAGQSVFRCGGTWWREVRPCFFRPVLPFLDAPVGPAGLPLRSLCGGYQYAARPVVDTENSYFLYLSFPHADAYCVQELPPRLRSYVRSAYRRFTVRPLQDRDEFKSRAYAVYLEVRDRTNYDYLDDRVRRPQFERWVDAEYGAPGLIALGAWSDDRLMAVSLSRVVGTAWVYSSFFASNEALHGQAANLMLHHARSLAAATAGVTMVYAGMQKRQASASVDAFYLHRGAKLLRRPAVLHVNPIARLMLVGLRPDLWRALRGQSRSSDTSALETP